MAAPVDIVDFPEALRDRFGNPRLLGRGGMGVVYRARDSRLDRDVAVKILLRRPDLASSLARFRREARVMAAVDHPGILRIFDQGDSPEGWWLVLEFAGGGSLDGWGDEEPVPPSAAVPVLLGVLDGLEVLHAHGVVHRDVKPANLLRHEDGRVVVADLGLAFAPTRTEITATGAVVGTLAYLAPELLHGCRATPESDAYSWGATLYRVLEGRLPFEHSVIFGMARGEPRRAPTFSRLDADSPEAALIRACLAIDPRDRPTTRREAEAILAGRDAGSGARARGEGDAGSPGDPPGGGSASVRGGAALPAAPSPRAPTAGGPGAVVSAFLAAFLLTHALLPGAAAPPPAPPSGEAAGIARAARALEDLHRDHAGRVQVLGGRGYLAHRDHLLRALAADGGDHARVEWVEGLAETLARPGPDLAPAVLDQAILLLVDWQVVGAFQAGALLRQPLLALVAPPLDPAGPAAEEVRGDPDVAVALERHDAFRSRLLRFLDARGDALAARGPVGALLVTLLRGQLRSGDLRVPAGTSPEVADREARVLAAAVPWFDLGEDADCAILEELVARADARAEPGGDPAREAFLVMAAMQLPRSCPRDAGAARATLAARLDALARHLDEAPGWVDLAATWALHSAAFAAMRNLYPFGWGDELEARLRALRAAAREGRP